MEESLRHLYQSKSSGDASGDSFVAFNSLGWDRSEIIEIPAQTGDNLQQYSADKNTGYVRGMEQRCPCSFIDSLSLLATTLTLLLVHSCRGIVDNGAFAYGDIANSKSETSRVHGNHSRFPRFVNFFYERPAIC